MSSTTNEFISLVKSLYPDNRAIHLHEPVLGKEEKSIMCDVIDSGFVSSVGPLISEFEDKLCEYTKSNFAVATNTGTSALHAALLGVGVEADDEVITQSLSFAATSHAIKYCNAKPVFLDVETSQFGLSPEHLENFLNTHCEMRDDGRCWNSTTGCRVSACVPTHIFGFAAQIEQIVNLCQSYNIKVVEDAAEAMGSFYKGQHLGTFGDAGVLSFNGNKIITAGGGGVILCKSQDIEKRSRHLVNTAKVSGKLAIEHDALGFNYRMNNINAALGLAQLNKLPDFIKTKRQLAQIYQDKLASVQSVSVIQERLDSTANYWLNALLFQYPEDREDFMERSISADVHCRPVWHLLHSLPHLKHHFVPVELRNSDYLSKRLVNIPSGVAGLQL